MTFLAVTLAICTSIAQSGVESVQYISGEIYGGLPIQIALINENGVLQGWSKYGSSGQLEFKIEGEITGDEMTLFEFDEDHILSGILEVRIEDDKWMWNSSDYSSNLPITVNSTGSTDIQAVDFVTFNSYISVKYPFLDDEVFDKAIGHKISGVVKEIVKEYEKNGLAHGSASSNKRFVNRAIGIHKITLDSEDLLSGSIDIYNNQKAEVVTLTFTYDKAKRELLDLDKIFKKNFNYSFFLKQYINQKKQDMVGLVSQTEAAWIKEEKFNYYVLTKGGLKFFGDHNTIFGRRSFMVPYHEIASSIGSKSLINYLKNRK